MVRGAEVCRNGFAGTIEREVPSERLPIGFVTWVMFGSSSDVSISVGETFPFARRGGDLREIRKSHKAANIEHYAIKIEQTQIFERYCSFSHACEGFVNMAGHDLAAIHPRRRYFAVQLNRQVTEGSHKLT